MRIRKLTHPHPVIASFCTALFFGLNILLLADLLPFAATVTLCVICILLFPTTIMSLYRLYRSYTRMLNRHPAVAEFMKGPYSKIVVDMIPATLTDTLFALFRLVLGFFADSFWMWAVAGYHLLLAGGRVLLLLSLKTVVKDKGAHLARKLCFFCGVLLAVMDVSLITSIGAITIMERTYVYPGYLIYLISLYTVYAFGNAVTRLILGHKRHHSPLLRVNDCYRMATALMSLYALQTALLTHFSRVTRAVWNAGTGTLLVVALAMLARQAILISKEPFKELVQ